MTSGVNAFYCSADQQIYFSNLLRRPCRSSRDDKWAADVVMAHEFGHALQGRTGILVSSARPGPERRRQVGPSCIRSRRLETQADCFSGDVHAVGLAVARDPAVRLRGSWTPIAPSATTR